MDYSSRMVETGMQHERRTRTASWILIMALAWVVSSLGMSVRTHASEDLLGLRDTLERIFDTTETGSASISYNIVDLRTQQVLDARNADRFMIPASNMKLVTSGTALVVLGSKFEFTTRMYWDEDARSLTVLGSGDPAFADPKLLAEMGLDFEGLLNLWIDDIAAAGITEIRSLIVDDHIFEDERIHASWPRDQLNRWYCAEVAGFNFFTNVLDFYPSPSSRHGLAPNYEVEPRVDELVRVTNLAQTTTRRGDKNSIWISRKFDGNVFTLHGRVRFALESPVHVTIHDPATLFAQIFAERLRTRDISVETAGAIEREQGDAPSVAMGEPLGRPVRTPLGTAMNRCNVDSQNMYAEALLKRVGHEVTGQRGSWNNGAAVIRMVLSKRFGPSIARQIVIKDGSGMSRQNLVTAHLLTSWLGMFYEDATLRSDFIGSLAVAGESGTLKSRFRGERLHGRIMAKTGHINEVSCLSGYVIDQDGGAGAIDGDPPRAIAFSILVNDIKGGVTVAQIKRLQDRIVVAIDEYLHAQRVPDDSLGG